MTSPLFQNSEVSLLFALRSRLVDCKANFRTKFRHTHLLCEFCFASDDTQEHMLQCKVLQGLIKSKEVINEKFEYNDLFKDMKKQKIIVTIFSKILDIRKQQQNQVRTTNPSTLDKVLMKSYNLHTSIVNFSFGN